MFLLELLQLEATHHDMLLCKKSLAFIKSSIC